MGKTAEPPLPAVWPKEVGVPPPNSAEMLRVSRRTTNLPVPPRLPVAKWEWITPEQAKEWLAVCNFGNRPLRGDHVTRMARDMGLDNWNGINGMTIIFDEYGRLINGQHRLEACVKSGVMLFTLVVRGVPWNSYETIDIGAKRSLPDLMPNHYKNKTMLAAVARLVMFWRNGTPAEQKNGEKIPTSAEMLLTIEEFEQIRHSTDWVAGHREVRGVITGSHAALIHFVASENGLKAEVSAFLDKLGQGIMLEKHEPVFHLRRLLEGNRNSKRKASADYLLAVTIKAWNATVAGHSMRSLSYSYVEAFPRL